AALANVQAVPAGTTNRSLWVGPHGIDNITLPPFMQFAVASGGNISIGMATISSVSLTTNASVYADGSLDNQGGVVGFGYYRESESGRGEFSPVFNPTNLLGTQQVEGIRIPTLDIARLAEKAGKVTTGSLDMHGTILLGTPQEPLFWYVGGNLNVSGATTIQGYGAFIVGGKVSFGDAIKTGDNSSVAIFSNGPVDFGDVGSVDFHLYSNDTIRLAGMVEIRGSLTSTASISIPSKGKVTYEPISCALTEPFWPMGNCDVAAEVRTSPADEPTTHETTTAPAPVQIELASSGSSRSNRNTVALRWTGSAAASMDVLRDGAVVATVSNSGSYSDEIRGKDGTSYTHQVCEAGTSICSNSVTTNF
ncbi:MAG: hypothetical protein ACI84D_002462, partial [Thalassolituus oleivorans]